MKTKNGISLHEVIPNKKSIAYIQNENLRNTAATKGILAFAKDQNKPHPFRSMERGSKVLVEGDLFMNNKKSTPMCAVDFAVKTN